MKTLTIIALLFLSGSLAQRRDPQNDINIEQLLLQADPASIERLLNEAVEASNAEEQSVVSVKQSSSVEISSQDNQEGNQRPRLFRPKSLRSRLRKRPKIQITNTLAPKALIATTTTEKPSRSSLFSSPRRRFKPRPRNQNKNKQEEAQVTTPAPSSDKQTRRFPGFIRRPRPRFNIASRTTTTTPTTTATTTTTTTTTTQLVKQLDDYNEYEVLEYDERAEGSGFEPLFPTVGTLLPTTAPTTPQPFFLQTFGPALPPQHQRALTPQPQRALPPQPQRALPPQRQRTKSTFRSSNRDQNRVRTRTNKNRSRGRQQVVELIPVDNKPIEAIEKPRSSPLRRIRPGVPQRQRQQPAVVRRPPPPPQKPITLPFEPFQFPLSPNPTTSFFEDIPFTKAAPARVEDVVEYVDEEEEEFVEAVTAAPTRRIVSVPKRFHVNVASTQTPLESGDRIKVLDRYSHRNEDGSFTWGYQSADGSFKEETIGVDCITTGRYGYIDPRGEVREFSYSSGIECDPLTKQPLQQDVRSPRGKKRGYFDYNTNRFVTADGRKGKLTVNKANRRRG